MPEHPLCAVTRSARIIEHTGDFLGKGGNDRGVEERIETGKDDTADDYADDDFHTGVDIALTCGGFDGCLDGRDRLVELANALPNLFLMELKNFFMC